MGQINYLIIFLILVFILVIWFKLKYRILNLIYKNKLCVVYNYYEKNETYKQNFIYFLQNGILDDVDYYIVINSKSSIDIPKKNNISVHFRENKGFDFGAFSYIINNKLNQDYDYYFFMNTSVKGPYLINTDIKWYEYFTSLFNDNTHLVGTTINICTLDYICNKYQKNVVSHVQSMFFALDSYYFNEEEINKLNFNDIIIDKEVGLSQNAINKGYNINCILSKYNGLDYINIDTDINKTSRGGDPYYPNAYFGETIDPYQVIFFKSNRGLM